MKKKNKNKPMTWTECVMHTSSPLFLSLKDCKPQTITPLKYKKKYQDAYKKEFKDYL